MSTTSTLQLAQPAASIPRLRSASSPKAASLWARLLFAIERRRQRDALGDRVDDRRLLDDIGLTRDQALREAAKPLWE